MAVKYSEEVANAILDLIEDGETLSSIARRDDMPNRSTITRWGKGQGAGVSEDFPARYEAALKVRLHGFVEDLIQIPRDADPTDNGAIQLARLECENRRWLLVKLHRDQFGDQSKVELGGETGEEVIRKLKEIERQRNEQIRKDFELMPPEEREQFQQLVHRNLQRGAGKRPDDEEPAKQSDICESDPSGALQ